MEIINKEQLEDSKFKVGFRPNDEIMLGTGFGVVFVLIPFWPIKLVGIVSLVLAGISYFKIKDYETIRCTKDNIYLFKDNQIMKFSYDEIEEWVAKPASAGIGGMLFALKDGEHIFIPTYQTSTANSYLFKFLNEKEHSEKAIKDREIKHKISPWARFKLFFTKVPKK